MEFKVSNKNIWFISFPVIISILTEKILEITDVIFLGRYGVVELGAAAIGASIYDLCLFLPLGLIDGIQIIIGRRAGESKYFEIGSTFNQGLYLLFLSSILMTIFIIFLTPYLSEIIFSSGDITSSVVQYTQIVAFGIFFHSINLLFSAFYVGVAQTRVLIGATIILAITNIILDYLLIFGNFGFPRLGIRGAAIGSMVAEILVSIFLTIYTIKKRYHSKYRIFYFQKLNLRLILSNIRLSLPVSLEIFTENFRWLIFFIIIEQMGEIYLAQSIIIFSAYSLFIIPSEGFSETICSMVSNLIGQNKSERIFDLVKKTIYLNYIIIIPIIVFTLFFPKEILSVFTNNHGLINGSVDSLKILIVTVLAVVTGEVYIGALYGTGATTTAFFIEFIQTLFILFYVYAVVFIFSLSFEFIWLSEGISCIICIYLAYISLKRGKSKLVVI